MGRSTYHPLPYLPTEVVSKILALLEIKELVACQCTSRRLRGIVSGSLLLQYHIRLAASGMHDGSLSEASTAERTAALREYTDAWRDLTWSAYDKIDIPGCAMPQFSDGVVAYLSEDRRALTVHQLPSKLRRLSAHRWTLEFDFVIARFSLDAAQDLLVLVPISATPGPSQWFEPRILLRALSTGQPHPLASPSAPTAGAIELAESKLQPVMDGDTTSIHGSYLGTVVHGGTTDELAIWNWKTGEREWGMPLDKGVGQWCFLDDAHILFPKNVFAGSPVLRARQRRLHVCRFRSVRGVLPSQQVDPVPERVFVLPDPRYPHGSSMGARLLSRPTPDPSASLSAFAAGELFHPSAEDHLLTVELWAYYASGWEVTDLHIPTRVLLSTPPRSASGNEVAARGPRIVPWSAWCHAITQSPPLEHPRDMAPLGPLAHGMRRLSWTCGTNSRFRAVRSTAQHSRPSSASSSSLRRKTVSVWDLHPGRTEQALAALRCSGSDSDSSAGGAAVIQLACSCGGGGDDDDGGRSRAIAAAPPSSELQPQQQQAEWPYVLSEVPLPREIQEADPIGIKFAMCGDALVVLELGDHETNKLHVLTF
ncbi:hypothetical protein EDB89DRAFT_919263 [Lactarius sanguifluus]|nr:hypothetical protein EDB89DRAFT_919263 [Lactarius sanguifluus]